MPKAAYFAHNNATRASIGMAGKGRPLKSCESMTLVRSSPVTVNVPGEPRPPACTWTLVITPSNSGCVRPAPMDQMRDGLFSRSPSSALSKPRLPVSDTLGN